MSAATSPPSSRTFAKVIALALVVIVGLGILIRAANSGIQRPEGRAERWLSALSDTGREGLREDAEERASRIGPDRVPPSLMPSDPEDDERYFRDLEVGRAERGGRSARVPFRLHQNVARGDAPVKRGTVVMTRIGDRWRVQQVVPRGPGEQVPSEGGDPPSRAPLGLWLGATGLGFVLAGLSHLVVRYADRSARRAMAVPG